MFLRQGDKYFLKLELLDTFESQVGRGRRPEGRTVQGENYHVNTTQGKIDLRNESDRPMKVKVVGEVSEK